ncbi:alanine dehydrogenase [Panacibacter sp. DH6]|uniref:Alanine dehydrogenase n=1 Tax=Panacibacter microcysteis TaxID=2793269 RepID=A0A931MDL4_9BACT|nr:NAD(P)-dependent oxidoreductase [Panacibacter microcysteis]MBG9378428.1 alanine dehydrogenase [Panacibacter microcysteis]
MFAIGLIKEGKKPGDNRVALTPSQCKWLKDNITGCSVKVQSSAHRCFSDEEYRKAGIEVTADVSDCDILMGIKEVPADMLIANRTYLFFSHTKKKQPYNQQLMHALIDKNITLIDYECLEHEDGQRIIGFGFFAGVVGAHNGVMAYGNRTGEFELGRVYKHKDYRELIHTYFGLRLPNIKIAVTGSGRVAHGILEIMNLMGVTEVEPDEYLERKFSYPVYVQLKGHDLYTHKELKTYKREHFHENAEEYRSRFLPYTRSTDILMNGIYWETSYPRLFEKEDINESFTIQTIADITDDMDGSVPINLGDQTIQDPVYGVHRKTFEKTVPYAHDSIDVMAVGNLPNELPRDASRYFGEQLLKYVLPDLLGNGSDIINRATMLQKGKLTAAFSYLEDYARH